MVPAGFPEFSQSLSLSLCVVSSLSISVLGTQFLFLSSLLSPSSLHNLLLFLFPFFKAEPRVVCLWLLWMAEFFGLGPGPSLTTRLGPAHLALPGLGRGPGTWSPVEGLGGNK